MIELYNFPKLTRGIITGLFAATVGLRYVSFAFGVLSVIFGILVLWKPHIISYLIGIYLVIVGIGLMVGGLI